MTHRVKRPLERFFTTSSIDKIEKKQLDINPIKKINKLINECKYEKNIIIDEYMLLLKSNCSKHKEFIVKLKLEKIETELELLIAKKVKILKSILNSI